MWFNKIQAGGKQVLDEAHESGPETSLTRAFKGIVHRKIKIHSPSSHHCSDGGVGEVFESTKHFLSLRGKRLCIRYNYEVIYTVF